jgi:DNA-binding NarL/FixJ family response regulator
MKRVLVAAAFPTVLVGLGAVLRGRAGIEVVGDAASAGQVLAHIAALAPDVLLAELEAEGEEMAGTVLRLAGQDQAPGVILLCDAPLPWSREALRAGVRGILGREASATAIVAAVEAVAGGLAVLQPGLLPLLLPPEPDLALAAALAPLPEPLTLREGEVLRLLGEGLGNKAICRRLGISEHTVKFHVGAIMAKLRAESRTEAVMAGVRRGLILL